MKKSKAVKKAPVKSEKLPVTLAPAADFPETAAVEA
jgi:hypothetical protein